MVAVNVNELIEGFHGGGPMYRHSLNFIYTEGVRHIAEKYSCFWALDVIFSHQLSPRVSEEPFQVWTLKRITNYEFMFYCEDGNKNYVTKQKIPYSDFQGDLLTLWLVDNTLLLPSEY